MEMGGNKPNRSRNKVRNAESTLTIVKGAPMYYRMNGTNDGVDVLSAANLAAANQGLFAGIAMQDIAPGKIREGLVSGLCEYTRVITSTRAASTDVWASYSAGALGDILAVNSATNDGSSGVQAISRIGVGSSNNYPALQLAQTTQASSIGGASIYSVSLMKVFVRGL
jgi:hypothetical protein